MEYEKEINNKTYSNEELLFRTIYYLRDMEKELKKAQSKIAKLEKALNYKKIAKYVRKSQGKVWEKALDLHDTTWADLENFLGLYNSHTL